MANLGFNVNVNDLPQDNGGEFAPLPAGNYNVTISDATLQQTKSGTGTFIKMKLTVTGPSHEGRVLFSNLNIKNDSTKAEEIGRQQLGAVMRAINLPSLSDTDQLIGGQMSVKVTVKQDEQYGAGNEVKSYSAINGSAAPSFSAPQPTFGAAAPAQGGSGKPAWMK